MSDDLKSKLAQLKELHELGLLTEADFQKQKDALLAAAPGTTPAAPARAVGHSEPPRAAQTWSARCAASSR